MGAIDENNARRATLRRTVRQLVKKWPLGAVPWAEAVQRLDDPCPVGDTGAGGGVRRWRILIAWWAATALVGSTGIGGGALIWGRWNATRAGSGWLLVPVLVMTRRLPGGSVLAAADLEVRRVPEQFVTTSAVSADAVTRLPGQRLLVGVEQGDLLSFSHLSRSPNRSPCARRASLAAARLAVNADPLVEDFLRELAIAERRRKP